MKHTKIPTDSNIHARAIGTIYMSGRHTLFSILFCPNIRFTSCQGWRVRARCPPRIGTGKNFNVAGGHSSAFFTCPSSLKNRFAPANLGKIAREQRARQNTQCGRARFMVAGKVPAHPAAFSWARARASACRKIGVSEVFFG